jgi:hypothetical protein
MATIRFADKLIRGTLTPTNTGVRLVCILEDWRITGLAKGQIVKLTIGDNAPHRRVVESVVEMADGQPAVACVSLGMLSSSLASHTTDKSSHDNKCFSNPTF